VANYLRHNQDPAVATAVTFGLAPVSTGLCERIMLGTGLPRR
jgi:drug/metabolite transporter, DME family